MDIVGVRTCFEQQLFLRDKIRNEVEKRPFLDFLIPENPGRFFEIMKITNIRLMAKE